MASVSGVNCETCNYRHVENHAAHWCRECEEGLCAECYQHHTHSKTSRYHGVIPGVRSVKKVSVLNAINITLTLRLLDTTVSFLVSGV